VRLGSFQRIIPVCFYASDAEGTWSTAHLNTVFNRIAKYTVTENTTSPKKEDGKKKN